MAWSFCGSMRLIAAPAAVCETPVGRPRGIKKGRCACGFNGATIGRLRGRDFFTRGPTAMQNEDHPVIRLTQKSVGAKLTPIFLTDLLKRASIMCITEVPYNELTST